MKGRTIFFLFLFAVVAMSSCSEQLEVRKDELAANTAKLYYQYLIEGKYEDFVAGLDRHIGHSKDYERQLVDNARMFVSQQRKLHKGMKEVSVANAMVDTVAHTAAVYLVVDFNDGVSEQIVVPMVERDGLWMMR